MLPSLASMATRLIVRAPRTVSSAQAWLQETDSLRHRRTIAGATAAILHFKSTIWQPPNEATAPRPMAAMTTKFAEHSAVVLLAIFFPTVAEIASVINGGATFHSEGRSCKLWRRRSLSSWMG